MYQHSLDAAALCEVHLIIVWDGLTAQMNYMRRFFPVGTIISGCNDLLGYIMQKQQRSWVDVHAARHAFAVNTSRLRYDA